MLGDAGRAAAGLGAKASFSESSLPFLSTLVRWTTFARLDLGIVADLGSWRGNLEGLKILSRIIF